MKYKLVVVGKIKEEYYREAIAEYVKRISRFASVEVTEVAECLFKGEPNAKEMDKILLTEGRNILAKCEGYVVLLDTQGKQLSSVEFAETLEKAKQTCATFTFVIGGSYGLSDEVRARADLRVSFGKITLPHQLCRVVLAEQLYRACAINNNIAYHK